ncbi:MAG: M23 family metallopeptidase [Rhodanobacter sp.]
MRLWPMLILAGACLAAWMVAFSGQGPRSPALTTSASGASTTTKAELSAAAKITVPSSAGTVAAGPVPAASAGSSTDQLAALPPSAVENLLIPVVGVKAKDLVDTFTDARSQGRVHDAIDIMASSGTPVVAVNDGHVVKLFTSVRGGLTVYEFDPQDQVIYYYAHLDSYAPGLAEGQVLHRGDPIGRVGSTGNASAEAPHLHFEIEILGPEKQWWHATSINPYGRFSGQR